MTSCMASFCINSSGWSGNMPEQIINKIKKRILPQWKVCFISAMIMGLIAHLYKITNSISRKANYEEILSILNNTLQGSLS